MCVYLSRSSDSYRQTALLVHRSCLPYTDGATRTAAANCGAERTPTDARSAPTQDADRWHLNRLKADWITVDLRLSRTTRQESQGKLTTAVSATTLRPSLSHKEVDRFATAVFARHQQMTFTHGAWTPAGRLLATTLAFCRALCSQKNRARSCRRDRPFPTPPPDQREVRSARIYQVSSVYRWMRDADGACAVLRRPFCSPLWPYSSCRAALSRY